MPKKIIKMAPWILSEHLLVAFTNPCEKIYDLFFPLLWEVGTNELREQKLSTWQCGIPL